MRSRLCGSHHLEDLIDRAHAALSGVFAARGNRHRQSLALPARADPPIASGHTVLHRACTLLSMPAIGSSRARNTRMATIRRPSRRRTTSKAIVVLGGGIEPRGRDPTPRRDEHQYALAVSSRRRSLPAAESLLGHRVWRASRLGIGRPRRLRCSCVISSAIKEFATPT